MNENSESKHHYINLDDDIEDTPGKKHFLFKGQEESSYLPMKVNPEVIEKKKIFKKVRFHDDDADKPVTDELLNQPKVGTKRTLTRSTDIDHIEEEQSQETSQLNENKIAEHFEKDLLEMEEMELQ